MSDVEFRIAQGGSKLELLNQLGDIGRIPTPPRFSVRFAHPQDPSDDYRYSDEHIEVRGIEAIDSSGDNWRITGILCNLHMAAPWIRDEFTATRRFEGTYNTRKRKGLIKPIATS